MECFSKLLLEMESDVKKQEEIEHAVNSLREELQQLETEWGGQAQLRKGSDAMAKKAEKARSALRKLEEERQQIVAELSAKRQKLELWHSGKRHEQHIYREQIAKLQPYAESIVCSHRMSFIQSHCGDREARASGTRGGQRTASPHRPQHPGARRTR